MSTAHQGQVSTGSNAPAPDAAAAPTDPMDPNLVAEARHRATAKIEASIPPDSVLITSRVPETAPFNIVIDPDHVLTGGQTTTGFIIWYCPKDLVDRLKRHMLALSGRVVLPEGSEAKTAGPEVPKPAGAPTAAPKAK